MSVAPARRDVVVPLEVRQRDRLVAVRRELPGEPQREPLVTRELVLQLDADEPRHGDGSLEAHELPRCAEVGAHLLHLHRVRHGADLQASLWRSH